MIKIGVIGFGKTGSYVCNEILKDNALTLSWVLKKSKCDNQYASKKLGHEGQSGKFFSSDEIKDDFFKHHKVDVVIDFSHGDSASLYYDKIAESKTKIVSAISHYSNKQIEKIKKISKTTPILYSPNITLGINWLIVASKFLKKIIPNADIEIIEEHFRAKKGVSGTALKIAEHLDLNAQEHVNSIRVGGIIGKHEIIFGLPSQTIRLVHESIDRAAFGRGAILGSKWLLNKSEGFYSMEDVLEDQFKNLAST